MSNTPAEPLPAACASARATLARGGDTPSLADRLHLASCPRCQPIAQQVRFLQTRSRRLPFELTPPALRTRVLEQINLRAIPEPFQPDVADGTRKRRSYKAFFLATGATSALLASAIALTTYWPILFPSVTTQIRQVRDRAQTWHFSGWKSESGKRVRWEVWGRRQPFLYREQVGDSIFVDSGSTRTQVLPPSPSHPRGLLLVSDRGSVPPLNGLAVSNAGMLANLGYGWERLRQVRRDGPDWVLEGTATRVAEVPPPLVRTGGYRIYSGSGTTYYGVHDGRALPKQRIEDVFRVRADARTQSPTQFVIEEIRYAARPDPAALPFRGVSMPPPAPPIVGRGKRDKGKVVAHDATAELTLAYNVPLPADIETLHAPALYTRLNLTELAADRLNDNRIVSKGIILDGQGVADANGNVRLRFAAFVNGKPYPNPDLPVGLGVSVQREMTNSSAPGSKPQTRWGAVDDYGRRYITISAPMYYAPERAGTIPDVYLAPLEPLRPGSPRPRYLRLTMSVSGGPSETTRDRHDVRPVTLIDAKGEMTVPLPTAPVSPGYDTGPPPDPRLGNYRPRFRRTFAIQSAADRASAYESLAIMTSVFAPVNATAAEKATAAKATLDKARHFRTAISYYEQAARLAARQPGNDSEVRNYRQQAENTLRMSKQQ